MSAPPGRPFVFVNMAMTADGKNRHGEPGRDHLWQRTGCASTCTSFVHSGRDPVWRPHGRGKPAPPLGNVARSIGERDCAGGLPNILSRVIASGSASLHPPRRSGRRPFPLSSCWRAGTASRRNVTRLEKLGAQVLGFHPGPTWI